MSTLFPYILFGNFHDHPINFGIPIGSIVYILAAAVWIPVACLLPTGDSVNVLSSNFFFSFSSFPREYLGAALCQISTLWA